MKQTITLDQNDAQLAIEVIKTEILRRGKAAVIAVADLHGELIALLRVDGAPFTSIQIATNKAYTAARDRKPSRQIGQSSRDPQKGFDISYYGDPKIVGWGGGLPVELDGVVVGSVGVSGLPEMEDIELAQLGIDAILNAVR
ncbi:MAG: heme-binding protein [Chloroflexi bacterium]|nr:heme-binding protein [Chloroflexota bacterium]